MRAFVFSIMCETIAAISTAYGEGGIGIIRISGPESISILRRIFDCKGSIISRRMTYGKIIDPEDDSIIDEVLAVYMKEPSTYTGEDVVEINCHGSMVSLRKTLGLVLREGARMAEPGEFTKRAFLNGRLDLSQAEAVIDVIKAKADASYEAALSQMEGSLSRKVREIRAAVLDILVETTVNIDYPDEDIEQLTYDKLLAGLETVGEEIRKLLQELKESSDESSAVRSKVVKIHMDTPEEAERRQRAKEREREKEARKKAQELAKQQAEEDAKRLEAERAAKRVVEEAKAQAKAGFAADLDEAIMASDTLFPDPDKSGEEADDLNLSWEYEKPELKSGFVKEEDLFLEGEGPSTPQEYMHEGTIPKEVVDDIARFIKRHYTDK